jgi:hypothetical protein
VNYIKRYLLGVFVGVVLLASVLHAQESRPNSIESIAVAQQAGA